MNSVHADTDGSDLSGRDDDPTASRSRKQVEGREIRREENDSVNTEENV